MGDNPSRVLLLVCSGPEQAPWAEERQSDSRAESPDQEHPSGHPTAGMLREGTAAQGQLLAAVATPCISTGERAPIWKGAEIKYKFSFP